MGFLDNVKDVALRGKDAAERKGRETQLKLQLNDLVKQRKDLAAQLGASLYDEVKDKPEFLVGREGLFDAMKSVDDQRAGIEAELTKIEEEAAAAAAAARAAQVPLNCPQCGAALNENDRFCTLCGTAVAEYIAAQKEAALNPPVPEVQPTIPRFCTECGNSLLEGAQFCTKCGAKVEPIIDVAAEPEPELAPEPVSGPESAPEPDAPFAAAAAVPEPPVEVIGEEEPAAEPVSVEDVVEKAAEAVGGAAETVVEKVYGAISKEQSEE